MPTTEIRPETAELFRRAFDKAQQSSTAERPAALQWWERDSEFSRILHSANVLFYCPSCDAMAYIGRITRFSFNQSPWRKDVFAWRNDPINPPVKS